MTSEEVFSSRYIQDCVETGRLIAGLEEYRQEYRYHREHDPMDVLLGIHTWTHIKDSMEVIWRG